MAIDAHILKSNSDELLQKKFHHLSQWLLALAILIGVISMPKWFIPNWKLNPIIPDTPAMTLLASLNVLLLGFSSMILSVGKRKFLKRAAYYATGISVLLGLAVLYEYLFNVNLSIDIPFHFQKIPQAHTAYPSRPSPETMITVVLIGLALLLRDSKKKKIQWLAILTGCSGIAIPILILTGYFSGQKFIYSPFFHSNIVGMSPNTSVAFLMLALAVLLDRPILPQIQPLFKLTTGGMITRRLFLAAFIVPMTLGLISYQATSNNILTIPIWQSITLYVTVVFFLILSWMTARKVDKAEDLNRLHEIKLIENERKLNAILESLPVGVFWTDKQGNNLQYNTEAKKILDFTPEITSKEWSDIRGWWLDTKMPMTLIDWPIMSTLNEKQKQPERKIEIETSLKNRKVISCSGVPLDSKISNVGMIAVIQDVTKNIHLEKKIELAATAAQTLLNTLDFTTALQHIANIAVPSICDWCSIHVIDESGKLSQKAMEYRASYRRQEILEIFSKYEANPKSTAGLYHVVETGRPILVSKVEMDHLLSIGQNEKVIKTLLELMHTYLIVPLRLRSKTIGAMAMACGESGRSFDDFDLELAQDLANLTALALDNAKLFDDMKKAVRVREDVVAVVSHDLNNPLQTVLIGLEDVLAELVHKQHNDKNISSACESAKLALRSAKRIQKMASDLLNYARIESGHLTLKKNTLLAFDLMHELEDIFSVIAKEKKISFFFETPSPHFVLYADHDRIIQAFSNFIANAIKFTPPGGKIAVHCSKLENEIVFSISDTGIGIDATHLPHLFDRFWQLSESAQKGTGLGLYIAKGIIEAHDGRISVESEKNKGTTFFVTLPEASTHSLFNFSKEPQKKIVS